VPKSPNGFDGRGVPDLAGDADPASGYIVRVNGQREIVGGTSAVAPLYAGLLALINQARKAAGAGPAGFILDTIYSAAGVKSFRDIVSGNNDIFGSLGHLYTAGPGWDACTGLGVADGTKWLSLFAAADGAHAEPSKQPAATGDQPRIN
jgi:kumamolisin